MNTELPSRLFDGLVGDKVLEKEVSKLVSLSDVRDKSCKSLIMFSEIETSLNNFQFKNKS